MLKRIPRRNHITPVLRELHWLRIHDRIIFKILLLTHKAVNNTAPEYLLFVHVHLLILVYYVFPQLVKRVLIHSLIDLLCIAAPTLWNALDLDIRLLPFYAFKKKS